MSSSSGAGGREMFWYDWELYDWTFEQDSDEPIQELATVDAYSASGGSSELTIPAVDRASEKEVTWFFRITATNWLGGVGSSNFEVGGVHVIATFGIH